MGRGIWGKKVRTEFEMVMAQLQGMVGKESPVYTLVRDGMIGVIETAEGNAYSAGYYGNGSLDEDLAGAASDD